MHWSIMTIEHVEHLVIGSGVPGFPRPCLRLTFGPRQVFNNQEENP
jgi:hypothetical protein